MKTWTLCLTLAFLIAIPAASVMAAGSAAQRTLVAGYVVNTLDDPGNVICAPSPQPCSLRAAVLAANLDGVASNITFSVTGIIRLTAGLPITEATLTTIDAGSSWIDLSGEDSVRHFTVGSGASLTLKNLVLERGRTTGSGGIVQNMGVLTVDHCSLINSQAAYGGAVFNGSGLSGESFIVNRSFFGFNTATTAGGAIHEATAHGSVTNSTFYNNTAPDGAVLNNASGWSLLIKNSTIAGNSATGPSGSSVRNGSGFLSLRNTIVANPAQGANCAGTINNQGNNIDSGASCGWASNFGSMSSTDPLLLPISGSGPSTSFGVSLSSPAVEGVTVDPTNCPPQDQRGTIRPIDGNRDGVARCDIGAVEIPLALFLPVIIR